MNLSTRRVPQLYHCISKHYQGCKIRIKIYDEVKLINFYRVLHNGRRATATARRLGSSGRREGRQGRIFQTSTAQNRQIYMLVDRSLVEYPPEMLVAEIWIPAETCFIEGWREPCELSFILRWACVLMKRSKAETRLCFLFVLHRINYSIRNFSTSVQQKCVKNHLILIFNFVIAGAKGFSCSFLLPVHNLTKVEIIALKRVNFII